VDLEVDGYVCIGITFQILQKPLTNLHLVTNQHFANGTEIRQVNHSIYLVDRVRLRILR